MKRKTDVKLDDRSDTIIFTVELESGRFKSQLKLPLFPATDHKEAVEQWLDMIATGIRIGATHMDVSWPLKEEKECLNTESFTSPSTPSPPES